MEVLLLDQVDMLYGTRTASSSLMARQATPETGPRLTGIKYNNQSGALKNGWLGTADISLIVSVRILLGTPFGRPDEITFILLCNTWPNCPK